MEDNAIKNMQTNKQDDRNMILAISGLEDERLLLCLKVGLEICSKWGAQ